MPTRRLMMTMIAGGAAATLAGQSDALAGGVKLEWRAFPAGETGFFRAPVLVWGPKEAVLIDGGFTLPDGQALADAIKATGRDLTTIYVSQSDPDYYFSLGPIKAAFPRAKVLAASDTIAAIQASVEKKLATWVRSWATTAPRPWRTSSCRPPSTATT
jgi:glyoxylase-like metal-dependent hydrolase (beta-lactamase superfamily II)